MRFVIMLLCHSAMLVYYIFDGCHGNKLIKLFVCVLFKIISSYDDHHYNSEEIVLVEHVM